MGNLLTTPNELQAALTAGGYPDGVPVRVLDVRWQLGQPDGRSDFRADHIPTALYVDLERELARHGDSREGRHPLPSSDCFRDTARRWGIRADDSAVVYDDIGNLSSSRAW